MSREVAVYRQTPPGIKSFKVDLDDPQVHSIELKQDWSLHVVLNRVHPLWFVGRPMYRRRPDVEAERADGRVHAEVPSEGGIEIRRFTPQAWELARIHQVASEEEAKALLQHCGKAEPPGFFSAASEPKPASPLTLKELAALLLKEQPSLRILPEFLLMIDERFTQSDLPTTTVEIHYDDIREECYNGEDTDDETIRRTAITPTKTAFRKYDAPYYLRMKSKKGKGVFAVITKIR
jgi:hypothetical protein